METSARTPRSKIWILIITAIVLCAIAVVYLSSNPAGRAASDFLNATASEKWGRVYEFMGPSERDQIHMDSSRFTRFCQEIAASGWPRNDRPELEEMIPYTPPDAESDTAWSLRGTHRFSVTFRRPDGSSDLHTTIEYRHDPTGGWHPDVLPFVLAVSRGTPQGHPVQGLINAMTALKINSLDTYPFHQQTTISKLRALTSKKRKVYLETPIQPLH